MGLENYGALIYEAWEVDTHDKSVIIGRWAEDGNEYRISVPYQLRDLLIDLQNELNWAYLQLKTAEERVRELRKVANSLFKD